MILLAILLKCLGVQAEGPGSAGLGGADDSEHLIGTW